MPIIGIFTLNSSNWGMLSISYLKLHIYFHVIWSISAGAPVSPFIGKNLPLAWI
jgi:hypothetical protein